MRKDQGRWFARADVTAIRQGATGRWRERLTKEQSDQMDKKFKAELAGTLAEKWWEDVMTYEK